MSNKARIRLREADDSLRRRQAQAKADFNLPLLLGIALIAGIVAALWLRSLNEPLIIILLALTTPALPVLFVKVSLRLDLLFRRQWTVSTNGLRIEPEGIRVRWQAITSWSLQECADNPQHRVISICKGKYTVPPIALEPSAALDALITLLRQHCPAAEQPGSAGQR